MGTFQASLRAIGDVRGISATVELEDGKLSIAAGDTQIGSWPLHDIELEPIPTGYRLAAEGDQILIELKDLESFSEELHTRRRGKTRRGKTPKPSPTRPAQAEAKARKPKTEKPKKTRRGNARQDSAVTAQPVTTPIREDVVAAQPQGVEAGFLGKLDSFLERSHERWGDRLPAWVFTRGMVVVALVALVTLVVAPGLISALLLFAGLLIVLFGAVLYTDPMLAVRFLRGSMTPTLLLIIGVGTLLLGVLLGTIAR